MAELDKAQVQVINTAEDVEGVFDKLGYTAKGSTQRVFNGKQVFVDQCVYTVVGLYEEPKNGSFDAYLACRFIDDNGKEVNASAGWWRKSVYAGDDDAEGTIVQDLPDDVTTDIEFYKWACGRKFRCFNPHKVEAHYEWDKDMQPPRDSRRYKQGLKGWWKKLDKPKKTWVYNFAIAD